MEKEEIPKYTFTKKEREAIVSRLGVAVSSNYFADYYGRGKARCETIRIIESEGGLVRIRKLRKEKQGISLKVKLDKVWKNQGMAKNFEELIWHLKTG